MELCTALRICRVCRRVLLCYNSLMRTIICEEYQKEEIYRNLTSAAGTAGITGIRLISPGALLRKGHENTEETLLKCAHLLQKNAGHFPVYRDMFMYPSFIEEVLSFARECILWEISPASLPASTAANRELAEIISLLQELPLNEKETIRNYASTLSGIIHEDAEIYPMFLTNSFTDHFIQDVVLGSPGKQMPSFSDQAVTKQLFYALSTRQEIEACAQDICRHEEPCTIVLCSYEEQLPVLRQVFERYQIPFSPWREKISCRIPFLYSSLVKLARDKDSAALLEALRLEAFSQPFDDQLFPYLEQQLTSPACPAEVSGYLYFYTREAEILQKQEKTAADNFGRIQNELSFLLAAETPRECLERAYDILRGNPLLKQPHELEAARSLRSLLNQVLNETETETDLNFLIQRIESITVYGENPFTDFCRVTDLSHPVFNGDTIYVLGCSGRCFPGIPVRSGLFDETYLDQVPGFPSLTLRHSRYMSQLNWLTSFPHVVYSYPTNDYQGREIQPAYSLKSSGLSEKPWTLLLPETARLPEHVLSPQTAKALFPEEDGLIHGSISRIERWFQCPYSYFIQSGLKVRPPQNAAFDPATIGTLAHDALDTLVKQHGKKYAEADEETVADLLAPYFRELEMLLPNETLICQLTSERLLLAVNASLAFLKQAEQNTLYVPSKTEEYFESDQFDGIHLRGIIDRIDTINDRFRILDYKSSAHSLSETKVKAGLQLQLLTYLLVTMEKTGLKPEGCYYFSLQAAPSTLKAAVISRKEGLEYIEEFPEEDLIQAAFSERRLAGWSFQETESLNTDFSAFHRTSRSPITDLELTSEVLHELYALFRRQLLGGDISLSPVTDACTFCDYRPVCRLKTGETKPVARVMADVKLQKGKGEQS